VPVCRPDSLPQLSAPADGLPANPLLHERQCASWPSSTFPLCRCAGVVPAALDDVDADHLPAQAAARTADRLQRVHDVVEGTVHTPVGW
jgi:hypothetical protein